MKNFKMKQFTSKTFLSATDFANDFADLCIIIFVNFEGYLFFRMYNQEPLTSVDLSALNYSESHQPAPA